MTDVLTLTNATGRVTLFDATGRPLREHVVTSDRQQLDVHDLPAGSYLLRVVRPDGTVTVLPLVK